MKENKWEYFFVIIGKSKWGKEDIDQFDSLKVATKMIAEYRIAMPSFSMTIIKRRELKK